MNSFAKNVEKNLFDSNAARSLRDLPSTDMVDCLIHEYLQSCPVLADSVPEDDGSVEWFSVYGQKDTPVDLESARKEREAFSLLVKEVEQHENQEIDDQDLGSDEDDYQSEYHLRCVLEELLAADIPHAYRIVATLRYAALLEGEVCSGRRKRKTRARAKGRPGKGQRKGSMYSPHVTDSTTLRSPLLSSELRVPMVLDFTGTLAGGVPAISVRLNPNTPYQPIVGGSTATLPMYAIYAQMYGFYRVVSYSYVVRFCNTETFPVDVWILNSDNDWGVNPTIASSSNPLSQRKIVGSVNGQSLATLRRSVTVPQIVGSNAPLTADSYRALINANPADLMWMGICAQSMTGVSFTTGVRFECHLMMHTLFHDRLNQ